MRYEKYLELICKCLLNNKYTEFIYIYIYIYIRIPYGEITISLWKESYGSYEFFLSYKNLLWT